MKDCKDHRFLATPRLDWYDLPRGQMSKDGIPFGQWVHNLIAELFLEESSETRAFDEIE